MDSGNGVSVSECSEIFNIIVCLFLFPEAQVLLKELDDGLGISEGIFIDVIDLLEGLGQGVFSKFTSLFVITHDFIVEDTEVQGKSKSDWVAWVKAC